MEHWEELHKHCLVHSLLILPLAEGMNSVLDHDDLACRPLVNKFIDVYPGVIDCITILFTDCLSFFSCSSETASHYNINSRQEDG